jgi:hypothetical protein
MAREFRPVAAVAGWEGVSPFHARPAAGTLPAVEVGTASAPFSEPRSEMAPYADLSALNPQTQIFNANGSRHWLQTPVGIPVRVSAVL